MSRHFSPPSLPPPRDHLRNPSTLNTEAFASASHFSPSLKTDEVTHVHHGPHIISNTCFHGGFFLCVCLSAAYQSVFATRAYSFDGLFDLFWGVRLNVLLRILSLFSSFLFWVALFSNCNVNYLPKFSSDTPPPSQCLPVLNNTRGPEPLTPSATLLWPELQSASFYSTQLTVA